MMKIIECPRDAMQGLHEFIPTEKKITYINQLLKVGFDTIDVGSFVSAKAIPQMRDTAEVVKNIQWQESTSKLLAIVANQRGAEEASSFDAISYLGFPLSISETFQQRNTNKSIMDALTALEQIQQVCNRSGKKLVTYISMGFGNPYRDPYDVNLVTKFVDIVATLGSTIISLADTIGVATTERISKLFSEITKQYPQIEIGAHLHATVDTAVEKIDAAYRAGCKRFDGALLGFGGCPMADDELVGNLATETIINFLKTQREITLLNEQELNAAMLMASKIFPKR